MCICRHWALNLSDLGVQMESGRAVLPSTVAKLVSVLLLGRHLHIFQSEMLFVFEQNKKHSLHLSWFLLYLQNHRAYTWVGIAQQSPEFKCWVCFLWYWASDFIDSLLVSFLTNMHFRFLVCIMNLLVALLSQCYVLMKWFYVLSCRVLGKRLVSNESYLMLATTLLVWKLKEGRDFCAFLFAVASSVMQHA